MGKFITEFGPIVSTQRAGKVHEEAKNKILKNLQTKSKKRTSSSLFSRFSRHLNVQQIYIQGKAYIVENRVKQERLVECLKDMMPANNVIVNKHLHERLEDIFQDSLRLLDTNRDRDIPERHLCNFNKCEIYCTKTPGSQEQNSDCKL